MIHTIHTLSIRQYGIIDSTENLSLLRRWWNPLPVGWFDTDSFFTEYRKMMGEKTKSTNDAYRMLAYNRILILDAMLRTMSVLMRNQNDRSMFSLLLNRKAKNYVGNMPYYTEKVKQITGIEIKDGNDLKKLHTEIQRRLDKFKERFDNKKEVPKQKTEFIDIVLGVFSIMEMSYVSEMKLSEFGRLRILADKRIKKIEKSNAKH